MRFLTLFSFLFIVLGVILEPSFTLFNHLIQLIYGSDILITDYFISGSIGAAFLNAGLVGFISIILIRITKPKTTGILIASVFLMIGFALFGKNILNIWPIILGSYLYAHLTKIKFGDILHISFFATSIAPIVSELLFMVNLPLFYRVLLSLGVGTSIGFFIVPISKHLTLVHKGFNLYNIGFCIGLLSSVYVSIMRSYGHYAQSQLLWDETVRNELYILFFILFILMIFYGILISKKEFIAMKGLLRSTGYLNNDYLNIYGFYPVLINMGLNGIVSLTYLKLINAPLNGPTLGGVLTVVGFGASGKHLLNILPIFIGVFLGSITKHWHINHPSIIFAALFGTALAPVAGEYGWFWGIVASYINSSMVLNSGFLHAGLNLYNTGFSVGLVTSVLIPVLESFTKTKAVKKQKSEVVL